MYPDIICNIQLNSKGFFNLKKFLAIILVVLFISFSTIMCIGLDLLIYADLPSETKKEQQIFIIKPGQKFNTTLQRLTSSGIIKNPVKFSLLARIYRYDKRIKAGEYLLSPSMSPKEIIGIIVAGKIRLHRITIPEGYNLQQTAQVIAESGFATKKEFLKSATDTQQVHEMGINAKTFEGYLFPDTYYFSKDLTPEKIISAMVKRFWSVFGPEWKKKAESIGMSIHQVVTLASIIEKETGIPSERPIISSVFHNRLKLGMRMESDPTVIYGIENFNGNLTKKDLLTPTPYNTYIIKGLPPGPIASMGKSALKAALYPSDTQFMYFVSKGDKTHKFSISIKDHRKAVRKYQLKRR